MNLRRSVIYHIFLDRFAGFSPEAAARWQEPDFVGGTLRGVQEKLPYLQALGVDILWLSPFCQNAAYHGYFTTDYRAVDPRFGSLEDLRALIAAARAAGMALIADFVPNHCHETHPFFQAARAGDRELRRWFYFDRQGGWQGYNGLGFLPRLNLDHPPARQYMAETARHWLGEGLAGLRLDYAIGPSRSFWRFFRSEVKRAFPEALLIGEVWLGKMLRRDFPRVHIRHKTWRWLRGHIPKDSLQREYAGLLDGVLDFAFQELMVQGLAQEKFPPSELPARLAAHYARYPEGFLLPSFLDSHDMNRFAYEAGGARERVKAAFALQMAQPQPAVIYYGSEIGLPQAESVWTGIPHADLHARRPMVWDPAQQDQELLAWVRAQIARRRW